MNIDDLIENKYYRYLNSGKEICFKYKTYKDIYGAYSLISDGYFIENLVYESYSIREVYRYNNYYEIYLEDIIEYLPINNIDRISYYRKQKINYLLNDF